MKITIKDQTRGTTSIKQQQSAQTRTRESFPAVVAGEIVRAMACSVVEARIVLAWVVQLGAVHSEIGRHALARVFVHLIVAHCPV